MPDSNMRQIKTAIKTLLGNVSGLSVTTIHPRQRNFGGGNEATFRTLFAVTATSKINGWEIEHESGTSTWIATNKVWDRRDVIVLRGYYGHDDTGDSEATFSAIVEGVLDVLNADQSLGGSVGVRTHGTPQIRQYGVAQLGGYLCHYAELALTIAWANALE